MSTESRPLPFASTLRRLGEITNASRVEQWLTNLQNAESAQQLVHDGLNQLIRAVNNLSVDDPLFNLPSLERTRALKRALGNNVLPQLDEITARDYVFGVRSAIPAMVTGQKARRGEDVGNADKIRTPSMPTHPRALIVGTALHLYERTIMEILRKKGVTGVSTGEDRTFKTDDIIFPLEEMALLMHAQSEIGESENPVLLKFFATPNNEKKAWGGLGWRKAVDVEWVDDEFAWFRLNQLFHESVEGLEGRPVDQIIRSFMQCFPKKYPTPQVALLHLLTKTYEVKDAYAVGKMMRLADMVYSKTWNQERRSS